MIGNTIETLWCKVRWLFQLGFEEGRVISGSTSTLCSTPGSKYRICGMITYNVLRRHLKFESLPMNVSQLLKCYEQERKIRMWFKSDERKLKWLNDCLLMAQNFMCWQSSWDIVYCFQNRDLCSANFRAKWHEVNSFT